MPLFNDEFLANFGFTRMSLICVATSPIVLPAFAGSAFRGIFGRSLRQLSCVAKNTLCSECPLVKRCAYPGVFEIQPNAELSIYSNVGDPPRPFVLEIPDVDEVSVGETFELGLTLFGSAVDHYPWVIQSFVLAGIKGVGRDRGTFKVERAVSVPSMHTLVEDDRIKGRPETVYASELKFPSLSKKVDLQFDTPVRVKSNGRLTDRVDFSTLVRNLMRRIAYLGAFHCSTFLDTNFRHWIDLADSVKSTESRLEWFDWTRRSTRQKRTMQLGGVRGHISYEGNLKPFIPLLAIGTITHLGKGTTFGLGRYHIINKEPIIC